MNEFEQNLLFAVTTLALVATLVLFVWQYIRMNRRDKGDGDPPPPASGP